ncbi:kininogen-1 [Anas acuta]|uniref:kininogen-1 n=1 Tax=Anas acuta TaxID=28680 RepID=UPI0035C8EFC9
MKPFIVLALCCSFISSRATPLPFEFLDCDNPDVFEAVDTALKKYNGDSTSGNQFALYMVMEAKRTVGPDKQLHVKYRIQETTCAAEENKPWQDCDYKASAEAKTGECTAQVHINNVDGTSNVSQDCQIVPVPPKITHSQAFCLGCFHDIARDTLKVSEILKRAIQKFNKHSDEVNLFKLVEIKEAKRQVVAGWNYVIKYEIKETNCSKAQFQELTTECKTIPQGRIGKCDAKAYESIQAEIVDVASQCKFPAEDVVNPPTLICAGCPRAIPNDSPELTELLKVSMEKYNSETNDDFYYKAGVIESATVQVVAGQKYHLIFRAQKTNCSKNEFEKLHENCEATTNSPLLFCDAQIYVVPWENKTSAKVNCSEGQPMSTLLRRPPGFTPFRSFAALSQMDQAPSSDRNEEESQAPGKVTKDDGEQQEGEGEHGHKHGHKHEHKHGHKDGHKHGHGFKKDDESARRHRQETDCGHRSSHGCKHRKNSKNGKHKHPKSESSEESGERVFNQKETFLSLNDEASEPVNSEVARKETGTPAEPVGLPDGLPDRLESPLPRCPGTPWKTIMDPPLPSSFPREFTNEDLLPSAVDNISPTTETSVPPQNEETSFDLSDALP